MTTKQSASSRVQIASHNPIDLVSHNEYVAQEIHQKIELMRYFLTTGHQWEHSLRQEIQPQKTRSDPAVTGTHPWKKWKHYLSFFSPLDWLRLTGFIIGISILWLGKLVAYLLMYFLMIVVILNVISKKYAIVFMICAACWVFFQILWRGILFSNSDSPTQSILKILWIKSFCNNSDKGLRPVILCLLPEWLNPNLNPSQLTITGEIDPLTLKRMWRKLSLFEKHVIMSDLKVCGVPNGEPQIYSVEFVHGSLPYRDELIASIYQGQQSKKSSKADDSKRTEHDLPHSMDSTNDLL
ncbi:hypothetical protein ACT5YR_06205 [Fructobacillus fructosus]|uniref:Uncharacterized protein n=1 Tax=Fructobacillus fructosus TaxID=1631 RepID=A0ABN9YX41_9LACO|nr:unnamed protein product [Fructobacillus fructosus]